jgi:hypothetical protein
MNCYLPEPVVGPLEYRLTATVKKYHQRRFKGTLVSWRQQKEEGECIVKESNQTVIMACLPIA